MRAAAHLAMAARLAMVALVTLIALEAVARLSGFAERHFYDPIYQRYAQSDDIPYVLKPGLIDARARGLSRVSTDELGLRTPHPERRLEAKRDGEVRIAFVGDSGTFGEGVVRSEDTFVARLEERMNDVRGDGAVRTFNFAASAYSVREMAASLEHRMLAVEPDWVVMVIIPHDLVLARTPKVDAEGYLVDRAFAGDAMPVPGASLARQLLRRLHVAYLLRELRETAFPAGRDLVRDLGRGRVPDSYEHVRRFRDVALANGLRPLVVLRPAETDVPAEALVARMRQDDIPLLDLRSIRQALPDSQYRATRFDPHPSAEAHRRISDALAAYFESAETLAAAPAPRGMPVVAGRGKDSSLDGGPAHEDTRP